MLELGTERKEESAFSFLDKTNITLNTKTNLYSKQDQITIYNNNNNNNKLSSEHARINTIKLQRVTYN